VALSGPPSKFDSLLGLVNTSADMWKHNVTQSEFEKQLAQAQINAMAQANIGQYPTTPPPVPPPVTNAVHFANRAREMFLKRMGGIRAEMRIAEGDFLQCHVYGEVVHVFYCFGGRPGVAQESIDLFPSDQFITQFRMVLAS
jgi:hypothetical protein